jgi:type IX secretion system PorP/SprF family membrane protein
MILKKLYMNSFFKNNKSIKVLTLVLFLIILFFTKNSFAQQDPQYSQYMFNHIVINPGYAGSKDVLSVTAQIRKQWVGIEGAPQTNDISIHGPLKKKHIGVGGHMMLETIGPKRWAAAYGDFAYRLRLGHGDLGFGLSAGFMSYQFDYSKISYGNQNEFNQSIIGELNKTQTKFDGSFGIYYHNPNMYIGYGVTHLTEPKLYQITTNGGNNASSIRFNVKRHHFISIGKGFRLSDNVVFSPSVLLKTLETTQTFNADLNLNFLLQRRLWLGASIRSSKNIIFIAQYLINSQFKVGYSFDLNYGGISMGRNNSHEIMIGYNLKSSASHIISPRYL